MKSEVLKRRVLNLKTDVAIAEESYKKIKKAVKGNPEQIEKKIKTLKAKLLKFKERKDRLLESAEKLLANV